MSAYRSAQQHFEILTGLTGNPFVTCTFVITILKCVHFYFDCVTKNTMWDLASSILSTHTHSCVVDYKQCSTTGPWNLCLVHDWIFPPIEQHLLFSPSPTASFLCLADCFGYLLQVNHTAFLLWPAYYEYHMISRHIHIAECDKISLSRLTILFSSSIPFWWTL